MKMLKKTTGKEKQTSDEQTKDLTTQEIKQKKCVKERLLP